MSDLKKVCVDCGVEKTVDMFFKSKRGKYGKRSYCKACSIVRMRKFRQENPNYAKEHMRKKRGSC
jgi:hypothetical protein